MGGGSKVQVHYHILCQTVTERMILHPSHHGAHFYFEKNCSQAELIPILTTQQQLKLSLINLYHEEKYPPELQESEKEFRETAENQRKGAEKLRISVFMPQQITNIQP